MIVKMRISMVIPVVGGGATEVLQTSFPICCIS